jgi:hypothetical protein
MPFVTVGQENSADRAPRCYLGTYGSQWVSKAALLGAIPPFLLKTDDNPEGVDQSVFDGIRAAVVADRRVLQGVPRRLLQRRRRGRGRPAQHRLDAPRGGQPGAAGLPGQLAHAATRRARPSPAAMRSPRGASTHVQ